MKEKKSDIKIYFKKDNEVTETFYDLKKFKIGNEHLSAISLSDFINQIVFKIGELERKVNELH